MVEAGTGREEISRALEDYLKAVYLGEREDGVVRVRDITRELNVKAPSVTAAMKRLATLGLVRYVQRAYVRLTPSGVRQARRVEARHRVLLWFFEEVLAVPEEEASENAHAIEHVLSAGAMDRLVRLFEFARACPAGTESFLDRYHRCPVFMDKPAFTLRTPPCGLSCSLLEKTHKAAEEEGKLVQLAQIKPGGAGKVLRVEGNGEIRQRLIEMGLLPDQVLSVERTGPRGDPLWIRVGGFQLALRKTEARLVIVSMVAD